MCSGYLNDKWKLQIYNIYQLLSITIKFLIKQVFLNVVGKCEAVVDE